jgi:hypothetical protein
MMTARRESFPVSADNAVRKLLAVGKRWKTYAESIASTGYVGGDATGRWPVLYGHLPLPIRTDVQNSAVQPQNIVPFNAIRGGPGQQCFAELLVHCAERMQ